MSPQETPALAVFTNTQANAINTMLKYYFGKRDPMHNIIFWIVQRKLDKRLRNPEMSSKKQAGRLTGDYMTGRNWG